MAREIVLDTETTGLDPRTGHRVIEIACIEVEDLLPTGRHFHRYINPGREIDPEAERVHGISLKFLADKPAFDAPEICDEFLDFVGDAQLVAHNAPFDRGFINSELERAGRMPLPDQRWVCTYVLAQKRFP
ncbi:MAG: exonuclease domain-containing protein, partial [Caulobacteraceae bacterium]